MEFKGVGQLMGLFFASGSIGAFDSGYFFFFLKEQSYLKEWLNGGTEKHFLEQVGTQEEGSGYRGLT